MHLSLVKISVLALFLAVESNGGLVDGVYERIKNTTTGLRQDVRNVWSYSKGLVGKDEPAANQTEGLIGGMIHSAHEKMHSLHEQLWKVEDIPNDSGLLWNMYCRLKQRLAKAKHFILGDGNKPVENNTQPPNPEAKLIKDTMDKLFNADGTRKIDGDAFTEAVENLRKELNEMRENSGKTEDGEGLIDIRLGDGHFDNKDNAQDAASVGNDIYDKVYDNVEAANDHINRNAHTGMQAIKNGLNEASNRDVDLKDKASDAIVKEKDLLDSTYTKLSLEANHVDDDIKKSIKDMQRLA